MRVARQRTGRPSRRAAQAQTTSSGCSSVFMPKPPPTSPTVTRTCSAGMPSSLASDCCMPDGFCELACSVSRPLAASTPARAPRGSIVTGASRWLCSASRVTCCARANAASQAAALPKRETAATLPGASGHSGGADSASAASSVATAGNGS